MANAQEELQTMWTRTRIDSLSCQPPLCPSSPILSTPVDPVLHIHSQVAFGNRNDPIFRDRTFNSQGLEEARALLVASHRSSQGKRQ